MSDQVCVRRDVGLNVRLYFFELGDCEARDTKDDRQDVDPMVYMVLELVEGGRDVDLLFSQATDIFAVYPSPSIRRL